MGSILTRGNEIFNIFICSLWCRGKARGWVPPLNTRFPLPTLLCVGYSVNLKKVRKKSLLEKILLVFIKNTEKHNISAIKSILHRYDTIIIMLTKLSLFQVPLPRLYNSFWYKKNEVTFIDLIFLCICGIGRVDNIKELIVISYHALLICD